MGGCCREIAPDLALILEATTSSAGVTPETAQGDGRRRVKKNATRWLCWEAAANESPPLKFPDIRENTGNLS